MKVFQQFGISLLAMFLIFSSLSIIKFSDLFVEGETDHECGDSGFILYQNVIYNGKTLYVGGSGPGNYSKIQDAVDATSNGDKVVVAPGTYQEEITIKTEIWIQGSWSPGGGVKLVPPAVASPVGFTLESDNVTITRINITDFWRGIYSDHSGHNFTMNTFWMNTQPVMISIFESSYNEDLYIWDFILRTNRVEYSSSSTAFNIIMMVFFDKMAPYNAVIGNTTIMGNDIKAFGSGNLINYGLVLRNLLKGTSTIGKVEITGNVISGGSTNIQLDRELTYFEDTNSVVGDVIVSNNRMLDFNRYGISIDYLDTTEWSGNCTGDIGDLIIRSNYIMSERTSSGGIYLSNWIYLFYFSETSEIDIGGLLIGGNTIDVAQYGISVEAEYLGAHFTDDSKGRVEKAVIKNNGILNSNNGISLAFQNIEENSGNSVVIFEGIDIIDNSVNSSGAAVDISLYYLGTKMEGSSSAFFGDIAITGNEFTSKDEGIYFYVYRCGFELFDQSSVVLGNLSVGHNTIIGDTAIRLSNMENVGSYMYNYSYFSLSDIKIFSNNIATRENGIYVEDIIYSGYEMWGNSTMDFGRIILEKNDIIAEMKGIFIGYIHNMGYNMGGDSIFRMHGVHLDENTITSGGDGIDVRYLHYFGCYLSDRAFISIGNMTFDDNIVYSGNIGINVERLHKFGYSIIGGSTFDFQGLSISNNIIESNSDGILIYLIMELGYYITGSSRLSMGSIEVNGNFVDSGAHGIRLSSIGDCARYVHGNSSFHIDNIQIKSNIIDSRDRGITMNDFVSIGNDFYDDAQFTMGNIEVSYNEIVTQDSGIYLGRWGNIVSSYYDRSEGSMGDIRFDNNKITAGYYGIDIFEISYIVEGIDDNSRARMGNLTFNMNIIVSNKHGINIWRMEGWGASIRGNARGSMDSFTVVGNNIESTEESGLYFKYWEDISRNSNEDGYYWFGGLYLNNNIIKCNTTGLNLSNVEDFGYRMNGNAYCYIDTIQIEDNDIKTNFGSGVCMNLQKIGYLMEENSTLQFGSIRISENSITSKTGIELRYQTTTLVHYSTVQMGDLFITGNNIISGNVAGLTLQWNVTTNDFSRFLMGAVDISENDIYGSSFSAISSEKNNHQYQGSTNQMGPFNIVRNNFGGCYHVMSMNKMENVRVYLNNFVGNYINIISNETDFRFESPDPMWYRHGISNYSSYLGNYWSGYDGKDDDDDGIGDTPYDTKNGNDNYPLISDVEDYLPPWNDITPPEVVIVTPSDGDAFRVGTVTVTWIGSDDLLGIKRFELRIDDDDWIEKGMNLSHDVSGLNEGIHTFTVKAIDKAGNKNQTSINVTVDMTAPSLIISEPLNGSALNRTSIEVKWIGEDKLSGISRYWIAIDDQGYQETGNPGSYKLTKISEGWHTVFVRAEDRAGNEFEVDVEFLVDTTDPEGKIFHPTDGMVITGSSVNMSWLADDDLSGILRSLISLDGENWTDTGMIYYHVFEDLIDGDHSINLRLLDRAGNWNETTVDFTVDSSLSVLEILSPLEGSYLKEDTVTVTWVTRGMEDPIVWTGLSLDDGEWSEETGYIAPIYNVNDGHHSVRLRVEDHLGNAEEVSVSFTVDTIVPYLIDLTHNGTDARTKGPIRITVNEPLVLGTFWVEINEVSMNGSWDDKGLVYEIPLDEPLEAGTIYRIHVRGRDEAGNLLDEELSFITTSKGTITGRIVDENGDPVAARVFLDTGEWVDTDDQGRFIVEAPQGSRKITVEKDGEKIGEFEIEVFAGETADAGDLEVEIKEGEDKDESDIWWLLIVLIVIILIVLAIGVYFLFIRKVEVESIWDSYEFEE